MGYSVKSVEDIERAGPGGAVRFVRRELGLEAFGINWFELPPGSPGLSSTTRPTRGLAHAFASVLARSSRRARPNHGPIRAPGRPQSLCSSRESHGGTVNRAYPCPQIAAIPVFKPDRARGGQIPFWARKARVIGLVAGPPYPGGPTGLAPRVGLAGWAASGLGGAPRSPPPYHSPFRALPCPRTGRKPCIQARSGSRPASPFWARKAREKPCLASRIHPLGGRPGPILNTADHPSLSARVRDPGRDEGAGDRALPRAPPSRKPCVQADLAAGARPPRPLGAPQNWPRTLCSSQIQPVDGTFGHQEQGDASQAEHILGAREGWARSSTPAQPPSSPNGWSPV